MVSSLLQGAVQRLLILPALCAPLYHWIPLPSAEAIQRIVGAEIRELCRRLPRGCAGEGKAHGRACGEGAAPLCQSPGHHRAVPPPQAQKVGAHPPSPIPACPGSPSCEAASMAPMQSCA